jgi:urea transport system permease protein
MAFFAIGGYMLGMWLMYARTEEIVVRPRTGRAARHAGRGATGHRHADFRCGRRVGIPPIWFLAHSFWGQLLLVMAVPGLLALVFGWLAFRSRVTGVYLSILTQAMTLALALYLFQNDSGLRGNNGLSGLQNLPGLGDVSQDALSIWFFWASAFALGLATCCCLGRVGQVRLGDPGDPR